MAVVEDEKVGSWRVFETTADMDWGYHLQVWDVDCGKHGGLADGAELGGAGGRNPSMSVTQWTAGSIPGWRPWCRYGCGGWLRYGVAMWRYTYTAEGHIRGGGTRTSFKNHHVHGGTTR